VNVVCHRITDYFLTVVKFKFKCSTYLDFGSTIYVELKQYIFFSNVSIIHLFVCLFVFSLISVLQTHKYQKSTVYKILYHFLSPIS